MNSSVINEKSLLAEIERLREQFPDTRDLYREVCVLLFFRHGMTPTANKLYQLVRKGSMSAPAEALNKFWDDLREKSRVRIEHPDLPEALKTAAGELTAALWSTAQAAANDSLAAYCSEAQAAVAEAKAALAAAEAARDADRRALEQAHSTLDQAQERIRTLEQQLAAVDATKAAVQAQLEQARTETHAHQHRLDEARRDFAADLDKLRAAADLAEERFRAAETRALLEIDRERTVAAKLQKELDTTRSVAGQAEERRRVEHAALVAQLGDLRQQIGVLEGNLQAASASRDRALQEIKELQAQVVHANTALAEARLETERCRNGASHEDQSPAERQHVVKPRPAPKARRE